MRSAIELMLIIDLFADKFQKPKYNRAETLHFPPGQFHHYRKSHSEGYQNTVEIVQNRS